MEGSGDSFGLALATDNDNAVYLTGYFKGLIDLNPGSCDLPFSSLGDTDVYVVKLDADGYFVWGRQFGGANADVGNAISVDANGNVYTSGYFTGEANFDANLGTHNIISKGDKDAFIQKVTENVDSGEDDEVLPLHIVNFKGNVEQNANSLTWDVHNQANSLSFEIERSNGSDFFNTILTINNSGNIQFFYRDKSPFDGHNYYRIKQIDKNGEVFYSETILLDRSKLSNVIFNVYPNPIVNNLLTISRTDGKVLGGIIINDSLGRTVFQSKEKNADKITINTAGWASGLYLIKLQDKSSSNYFKIIK